MITRLSGLLRGDNLSGRARQGSVLTGVDFIGSNLLRLVSNLILTRLLFPEAFGLMALVQVVTGGIEMFSDLGIRASLVRHERGDDPDFVNTAWTLQIVRGIVLWLAVVAVSPLAASFYEEPMLAQLLPVVGLSALISGFTPTSIVTANRHLVLGRVTLLSIGNQAVTVVITVLLAWWLQSVWAIVFGILAGALVRNISIRLVMRGMRNRFRLERAAAKDLVNFGKFILIGTMASFLLQNADRAILGKFISIDLLGVYAIGLTLSLVPYQMMQSFTWKVVFPLYSRRPPHESEQNRRQISKARHGLAAVVFLGAAVLILIGDPLVRFLYPSDFHAAGAMTVLIAIGLLPQVVLFSYTPVLLSANRSDLHAISTTVHAVLKVAILYVAIQHYGIVGAALTPIVSSILYYPVLIAMIRPWKAWDVRYDLLFLPLSVVVGMLGWWLNADAIAALFAAVE